MTLRTQSDSCHEPFIGKCTQNPTEILHLISHKPGLDRQYNVEKQRGREIRGGMDGHNA